MSKKAKQRDVQLRGLPLNGRNAALRALLLTDQGHSAQRALALVLDVRGEQPRQSSAKEMTVASQVVGLSFQDRALCTELVYGCLRTEIRLDFILFTVLPKPQSLPRPMLLILAIAVYGLLFQDKVPAHAVIHEAVEQVRQLFGQGLSRVANGALRSLQRAGQEPLQESFYIPKDSGAKARATDAAEASFSAQCVFYSLPLWIGKLWQKAYGEEAFQALLRRSFERPYSALRINAAHPRARELFDALALSVEAAAPPVKIGQWGLAFAPGQLPREALGQDLRQWQGQGALSFQSAGSQMALLELGLDAWREPVWDACAGYGGKSMALMERGVPVGLCTDCSRARLRGLPAQCATLGLAKPVLCLADATHPPVRRWNGHILVDAPCSGLGVLARRPDIRRREPQHLAELEVLQRAMLGKLGGMLQPGKELAYITCTLNPAENELAVEYLLDKNKNLRLIRQWQTSHEHPWLEGMYGALLRNEG
ncbi:MAG: transcription antitermination factor NusB [Desulfovibrio sp.]|nr:transcription antitermination factor NusB [Desulfovibrio sp.]